MFEKLRDYQVEDATFISNLPAAGLFNEQRTGKTPTALYALQLKKVNKVLIICPASMVYVWAQEYTAWTGYPCVVYKGPKRKHLLKSWTHGLVMSYGLIYQDGETYNLLQCNPEAIVLDEAHRLRGRTTATAEAAFRLKCIPYRLALTGTPTPGRAHQIWSLFHFLYPKQFRSFWKFAEEYFTVVDQMNWSTKKPYKDIGEPNEKGVKFIQYVLKQIGTNRKRKDVMTWLPDKDYTTVYLPPNKEQLKYLSELLEFYETEDIITHSHLDRLIRYRQICIAPELLGLKGQSPKADWVKEFISDYPDKPIIIFSKFTSFLKILYDKYIKHCALIIGETTMSERQAAIKLFQSGALNVLLINIDAGKEGITLDRAEAIVFTDRYPPVGDLQQAEDRFVSTTEDKADKPHTVYNLVLQGTYDEDIQTLITARATEVDVINNFKQCLRKEK